jgi:2-methylisocitrate lyase-like PEP mutase family enzyme
MATSALTQHERAERLRSLHRPGDPLVLFNVWDAVSARIVEQLGYPAIATGSAAVAWTQGYPDGQKISRDEMLAAVARIARAVSIPLTADLESAYGFTQQDAAATARGAIEAGAVGLNFEDAGRAGELLDPDVQCERIAAMVQAGQSAGVPLVINARTDVFLHDGKSDAWRMEEAIRRGNRFLQAGADCVFVLGVSDEAAIAQLAREIDGPINVFATAKTPPVARLAELGVARISVGPSGLAHALKYVRLAAQRLRERGTFEFTGDRISGDEIDALFG